MNRSNTQITRRSLALTLLPCMVLLIQGCVAPAGPDEGFHKRFIELGSGMTEAEVRAVVGPPDRVVEGIVRPQDEDTLRPNLAASTPVGTPFHDWTYSRGDRRYHLYMIPDAGAPSGWVLLRTRDHPVKDD